MLEFPEGAVLVVGGSGGIGSAIAVRLARDGADVALSYRRDKARAESVAAEVRALGRKASTHAVDLADAEAVSALFAAAGRDHGRLHGVVHAAGSAIGQPRVGEIDPAEWRAVID